MQTCNALLVSVSIHISLEAYIHGYSSKYYCIYICSICSVDTSFLRSLDSSIRRNTTVIKKLKQITEEQREGLLEDLRSINLSKFVSEAVGAICDAKLRSSDIQAAVQVDL